MFQLRVVILYHHQFIELFVLHASLHIAKSNASNAICNSFDTITNGYITHFAHH